MEGRGRDRDDNTNRTGNRAGRSNNAGSSSAGARPRSSGVGQAAGSSQRGGASAQRGSGTTQRSGTSVPRGTATDRFVSQSEELSAVPSRRTSSRGSQQGLASVLERFGLDESVVDVWRNQAKGVVKQKINQSVQEFDVDYALDRAREYATMSGDKLKKAIRKNPTAFYSGIAAVLVGAGLIATAARAIAEDDDDAPSRNSRTKSTGGRSKARAGRGSSR